MNLNFEVMSDEHSKDVMDIFNYYIENSFSAYPEIKLPYEFFYKFLEISKSYPAFVIKIDQNKIIDFCLLRAYNPFPVFKECGRINNAGKKNGEYFDVVLMEKNLNI